MASMDDAADGLSASEPVRRRDAAATRQALLDAARELFGAKGYDGTTLREIGEKAGADAALVARYFGNKMALYSASIVADATGDSVVHHPRDFRRLTRRLLVRVDTNGLGPIMRAMVAQDADPEVRRSAQEHLQRRIITPFVDEMQRAGVASANLRAELILATLIGVVVMRSTKGFPTIGEATQDDVVELLGAALETLGGMDPVVHDASDVIAP